MSSRHPTDVFGSPIGGGVTQTVTRTTPVDTSKFLQVTGGSLSGNVTLTATPTDKKHLVTVEATEDANNLKTGSVKKELLPQTLNAFALDSNSIFFKNLNDSKGYIGEKVHSSKVYAQLDGSEGVRISTGGTNNYLDMKDNKIDCNDKELENIKKVTSKEITSNVRVTFKELKSDNATEPIIINDNGMTLDDHTLRFRGQPDNNNSIRWFNGDQTNGTARLEVSTVDRLRLSTFRGKNNTFPFRQVNGQQHRDYTGANAQYIELLHDRLDVNNNRITNLSTPQDSTDAVTKGYVDSKIDEFRLPPIYRKIIADYSPTFWISSRFGYGYESEHSTIQDLTGTGLTVTGPIGKKLELNSTSRIVSTATYAKTFTFFIKARRTNTGRNGRAFTSSSGNKLFGWWGGKRRTAWIEGNIYGVTSNTQTDNNEVNTYMLVSNNDTKDFYEGKTKIINTTAGDDDWGGSVVIGRPTTHPNENTDFNIHEAIAFPTALTETDMFSIYDKILA